MAPRFGTSGLRGLVSELTAEVVADHIRAFLAVCETGGGLFLGRDLRESSPAIAHVVAQAARADGVRVTDCGALPTPALALGAMAAGQGAVMVTGSHIPADRNGLKFYTREGEITKDDEGAILAALGRVPPGCKAALSAHEGVARAYAGRYLRAFGPGALAGLRIGVWQHSSVSRDLLVDVLAGLGARVVPLGRAETFVAVDTEAVDAAARARLAKWVAQHGLNALVSADGDGDRPLMLDAAGALVPGDILGHLTAAFLCAEAVVTPVSSNTGIERDGRFRVIRTRIGSPHVIAGLAGAGARAVGYEANGGFLLGFDAQGPAGPLAALPTRDAFLPILAALSAARAGGVSLADLVARLPARFTASDRLTGIGSERARALMARLATPEGAMAAAGLGLPVARDMTDGLRLTDAAGRIVHFRPSGNAPEFRVYSEAETPERARAILAGALEWLRATRP